MVKRNYLHIIKFYQNCDNKRWNIYTLRSEEYKHQKTVNNYYCYSRFGKWSEYLFLINHSSIPRERLKEIEWRIDSNRK